MHPAIPAQRLETQRPWNLYRWYDEHGVLLYLGITPDFGRRTKVHRRESWWTQWAATVEIDPLFAEPDYRIACAREMQLVLSERPIFNANPPFQARERLLSYMEARGIEPLDHQRKWQDLRPTAGPLLPTARRGEATQLHEEDEYQAVRMTTSQRIDLQRAVGILNPDRGGSYVSGEDILDLALRWAASTSTRSSEGNGRAIHE